MSFLPLYSTSIILFYIYFVDVFAKAIFRIEILYNMYPDLSYLFHDLFGTPYDNFLSLFKTFGLLLVLAILAAAYVLKGELEKRSAKGIFKPQKTTVITNAPMSMNDIIGNVFWGFVLGFKLPYAYQNYALLKQDPSAVLLSTQGNWALGVLIALAAGAYSYWKYNQSVAVEPTKEVRDVYPQDRLGQITFLAAISGVAGAKVFALIEDLPAFFADPWGMFFSGSGLAIYGGLIGGFFGVGWYLRKHKIDFLPFIDAVAPALIMGYAVGRLGCHFAGDGDWGIVNELAQPSWWFLPDWLWAYDYPRNVLNQGIPIAENCEFRYCHKLPQGVYPTPLYEVTMALMIFGVLKWASNVVKTTGVVFFIYMLLNGIERFLIEKIRVNPDYDVAGAAMTQAEMIAVMFFLIGVGGIVYLQWRAKNEVTTE